MTKSYIAKRREKLLVCASYVIVYNGPTSGGEVTLKTGRREVTGSNPGRACRPSRSEFSVVFSETRLNTE